MKSTRRILAATPAIWLLLVFLAIVNIARSTVVPSGAHFALNIVYAAVVVVFGVLAAGLGPDELGLSRASVASGLRWGAGAFVAVVIVAAIAALTGSGRDAMDVDDAHLAVGAFLTKVAVVIPVGTVLAEELVFRGVLYALLCRCLGGWRAVTAGAVAFGLWHVFPAWRADGIAVALGTFAATTAAGWGFVWLRKRSGSLVAPVLAHLATNTVPLTAGWLLAR